MQTSYPGVYTQEFAPPAPIQAVGTSTAAFLGPTLSGAKNTPQLVTSFDQFRATFSPTPVPGGYFLYYAVRGFFENGGTACYIVRTSNGVQASRKLMDAAGKTIALIKARDMGSYADNMQMAVTPAHLLANARLYQPTAGYSVAGGGANTIQTGSSSDAAQFRPGDVVSLGAADPSRTIASISGNTIRLTENLSSLAGGTIQLANTSIGHLVFRVVSSNGKPLKAQTLSPGSVLTISQGANSKSQFVDSVLVENLGTAVPITTYRVTLRRGLPMDVDYTTAADVQTEEFNLTITLGADKVYANLGVDPDHPYYFVDEMNDDPLSPVVVELANPPPNSILPKNIPDATNDGQFDPGTDENLDGLTSQDYAEALEVLGEMDDVNQIAAPDAANLQSGLPPKLDQVGAAMVQQAIIAHCELHADRFAVLDAIAPYQSKFPGTGAVVHSIEEQRNTVDSTGGYAGLYYPWLKVAPAGSGKPILVPPSGHVCGLIARIDGKRGVFKAPAGLEAIIDGAVDVDTTMSNIDQGQLNLAGINVIRVFKPGGRPTLFGARTTTTSPDTNWQYVNIRRLFLFLEKSIALSLRGSVFEPNNTSLWAGLKRSIGAFLTEQWQEGALFGHKAAEAFYVRIDEDLNPFSEQALGRLHIEIGVRPTYPAEFIIVRIGIWDGGSSVSET